MGYFNGFSIIQPNHLSELTDLHKDPFDGVAHRPPHPSSAVEEEGLAVEFVAREGPVNLLKPLQPLAGGQTGPVQTSFQSCGI